MSGVRIVLVCTAVTLASFPVQATAEIVTRSGCDTPKTSFKTFDGSSDTTSTTFIDMPGTGVPFTVGGTTKTCLTVEFSAELLAPDVQQLRVRALLDDVDGGLPLGDVVFKQGGLASNNTVIFSFVDVFPGHHTIKMQYLAEFNGSGKVTVLKRNTVVRHR